MQTINTSEQITKIASTSSRDERTIRWAESARAFLTAIANLPATIVERLEALDRNYNDDTTGFWNLLNQDRGMRPR